MNVLIISRYCAHPSFHGSAQHVRSFSKELLKNGHNIEVITGEDVELYTVKYYNNIKYHIVPIEQTFNSLDSLLSSTIISEKQKLIVEKIFSEFSPSIVHLGAVGKMLASLQVAIDFNIPTVAMMHDFFWVCLTRYKIENNKTPCNKGFDSEKCLNCITNQVGKKSKYLNNLSKILPPLRTKYNMSIRTQQSLDELAFYRNKIDVFIAQTQDHIEELKLSGISKDQIYFISQGLSKEKLKVKAPNKKVNIPIKIGYFGRVSKEKNVGVFIESLNLLSSENLRFHIVFIANGMTKTKIETIAHKKFNENISLEIFCELKEECEVSLAISKLDVCVITSSTQESPRCLLESIAQKVPCVIANILGNRYLINDNVNGRIFQYNDPFELKTILGDIIRNPKMLEEWKRNLPNIKSEEERAFALIKIHESLNKIDQ